MSQQQKYVKWSPEWEKEVIKLAGGKKEEKTIKKGEVKPDGTIATEETKINTNDLELLLGQIKNQKQIIKTKKTELTKNQGYGEEAKQILKEIKLLDPQVKEWDKFASWYESAYQKFLNGGTGGYGTANVGWIALLKTYLESKYKKIANTSPSETNNATATENYGSNLYEFATRTETDNNQISYWKITENEVVKLITRTVKALEDIDYSKFTSFTNAQAHPLSTGTDLDKTEYTATKLQGYLKAVQDRAKNLVDNTIKTDNHPKKGKPANGKRVEYSFGQDYTKPGSTNPVDSGNFTDQELIGLFRLMRAFQDSTWTNHADFKTATAEVKDDTLIVLPAKSEPILSNKLKEWGIQGYTDSSGKSNFYATDYGSKVANDDEDWIEYSWSTQKELKIEQGIKGWVQLINGIVQDNSNNYTNRQRLISSFTNDPVRQLFTDIRSYVQKDNSLKTNKETTGGTATPDYACFGSATQSWTYHDFPDHQIKEESRLNEYETEKASLLESVKTGRESLKLTEKEHQEAKKELVRLKKEIEDKIEEAITAKRKELKEKFKVSDTEANDFTDDNKTTLSDHYQFQRLVQTIRFLVNHDEEQATGKNNEDNAYQISKDISGKIFRDFYFVESGWTGMLKDNSGSGETCKTDEERLKAIKENKANLTFGMNLNWYHDKFVELAKLIKLEDWQIQAQKALKQAIDNQTPEETAKDWTDNLKQIETGLETAFTEDKIKEWKKKKEDKDAFNNLTSINTLLKDEVIYDTTAKKVKEDFITWLKGKDAKLTSLENLIKEKDPKEVITLIYRYKYNKLSDDKKKEYNDKFGQHKEKKGEDGKYLETYTPTEDELKDGKEFDTFLYELAIEKLKLSSINKKADETNDDNNDNSNNNQNKEMSAAKEWLGFGSLGKSLLAYSGILLLIGGVCAFIWWKSLNEWWNGPAEEEGGKVETEAEKVEADIE